MSDVHVGPELKPHVGLCLWTSHFEDVFLSCDDAALPGEHECAIHFIGSAHRRQNAERASRIPTPYRRRLGGAA